MHTVKVKICGITNFEDAQLAVDMGADMLGFNFYKKSPRYIEPEKAEEIVLKLPSFVESVGLFVKSSIDEIANIASHRWMNWAQLHGDQDPEFCEEVGRRNVKVMKAIRVKTVRDILQVQNYRTDAILLDSYADNMYGGTGKRFDWSFLKKANIDYFLAGGISDENIGKALQLGVYGIDVCSGIESEPGKKDRVKMQKLFEKISDFNSGLTLYGYKL